LVVVCIRLLLVCYRLLFFTFARTISFVGWLFLRIRFTCHVAVACVFDFVHTWVYAFCVFLSRTYLRCIGLRFCTATSDSGRTETDADATISFASAIVVHTFIDLSLVAILIHQIHPVLLLLDHRFRWFLLGARLVAFRAYQTTITVAFSCLVSFRFLFRLIILFLVRSDLVGLAGKQDSLRSLFWVRFIVVRCCCTNLF